MPVPLHVAFANTRHAKPYTPAAAGATGISSTYGALFERCSAVCPAAKGKASPATPIHWAALPFSVHDRGGSQKMLRALTLRVGLSVALFLLLFIAWSLGLIEPHGVNR